MDTITLIPLMVRPNMYMTKLYVKPLSTNPTRRSNTLKQFIGKLSTNCLSVFDHFVRMGLKGLKAFTAGSLLKNHTKSYLNLFKWTNYVNLQHYLIDILRVPKKTPKTLPVHWKILVASYVGDLF